MIAITYIIHTYCHPIVVQTFQEGFVLKQPVEEAGHHVVDRRAKPIGQSCNLCLLGRHLHTYIHTYNFNMETAFNTILRKVELLTADIDCSWFHS